MWDPVERCRPVCWTRRDGGWAADVWEWWQSARKQGELTGAWGIDYDAFAQVVPRAVREDDEARLDVIRAMQVCAFTLNNPKAAGLPDAEDEA